MRKLFALGVLLLVSVIALGISQGQAFNSGTHIYIVERVFPFALDKINLNYGSIAPDLAMYVPDGADWTLEEAFMDTHYYHIDLPYAWWSLTQRAFDRGWHTHNEMWGADYYAHVVPFDGDQNGYVIARAEELADLLPIPNAELAHFAIEVAIDVLLVRYHEPGLGLKLLWAAKYRSQEDFNLMAKAFVTTDNKPDLVTLSGAESNFRDLVINYAMALALPDPLRMVAISELGVQIAAQMGVSLTPYQVWDILRVAMYLCQDSDYMEVIQSAIDGIRGEPELIR